MSDFFNLKIIKVDIKVINKLNYFYNFKGLQINNNIVVLYLF